VRGAAEPAAKWIESRTENMISTNHGRPQTDEVKVGARSDGTITALQLRVGY
jgi:CO/xanthine dehydrogenase Mo-binding subunit